MLYWDVIEEDLHTELYDKSPGTIKNSPNWKNSMGHIFCTHRAKWMECNQWKINAIIPLDWNDQTYFQLPAKILLGNSCLPFDWWALNALAGEVQLFKPLIWKFKLQVTYPLRQTNTINFHSTTQLNIFHNHF